MSDNQSLIDLYEQQATIVDEWSEGMSNEDLDARPIEGKMTMRELIVHMMDSDLIGGDRIKRTVALQDTPRDDAPHGSPPLLLAYDENRFIAELAGDLDPQMLSQVFAANRRLIAHRLRQLPESAFERVGLHSEVGIKSLAELLKSYTGHVAYHAKFANDKREALGKPALTATA